MGQNGPILQDHLPEAQRAAAMARLPKMQPVRGNWLLRDSAFDAQLAEKARLLATCPDDVKMALPGAQDACVEVLEHVCDLLGNAVTKAMRADPLGALAGLIQEDVCILQKRGAEHVLTAGLLCFPASWMLAEKIGRPLTRIHAPVDVYDAMIAARVQRLFDGVQPGRPLWRANLLSYEDPTLYQPRREVETRPTGANGPAFERSERQTVLQLPRTGAVVFAIHTTVVAL